MALASIIDDISNFDHIGNLQIWDILNSLFYLTHDLNSFQLSVDEYVDTIKSINLGNVRVYSVEEIDMLSELKVLIHSAITLATTMHSDQGGV